MRERSEIIEWVRSELVGPSRPLSEPHLADFQDREFVDTSGFRRGPLAWLPDPDDGSQEVLYFERESPHRKYGAGLLHPAIIQTTTAPPDQAALEATDTIGAEPESDESQDVDSHGGDNDEGDQGDVDLDASDDFEVTSPDVRHPSTLGISFCVRLEEHSQITVLLPQRRRFAWQTEGVPPFMLNGRYEECTRVWTDDNGRDWEGQIWRRRPALPPDAIVTIEYSELVPGQVIRKDVTMPEGSPLALCVEVIARELRDQANTWLLTMSTE